MKTTAQIREQEKRIDKLLWSNATQQIKQADPDTGGNHMLCNNWGNDQSRIYLVRFMDRQSKLFQLFRSFYDKAFRVEYPEHLYSKTN